jgi:protein SCO1/2
MSAPGKHTKTARILFVMILGILATAAGIWSASIILDRQVNLKELDATRFPVARQLAPFALVDHNNEEFNETTLRNRWSFLFFGYTHCPDVCPTTLSVLNSVAQRLQDVEADIRFVFVSVDPERDTPEQLARFVSYFNENFIGVTGSIENINEFTSNLGIMHMQVAAEENATGYLVDHTASVLLMDPDGRYHAVFSPPLSAEAISADFRKILKAWRP